MRVAGFQKLSLIDYPGNIASVVFTAGCNFRCKYCHNPELVLPDLIKNSTPIPENYLFSYFKKNSKLLDAVVITGGEPTLQHDLVDFIREVKNIGLKVKLDTNGTNPNVIKDLLDDNLIDYIAMDIKAPILFEKYKNIIGDQASLELVGDLLNSVNIISKSNINSEFRTTIVKGVHSEQDIIKIADLGISKLYIQNFNPDIVLDDTYSSTDPFTGNEIKKIVEKIKYLIPEVDLLVR